MHGHEKKRSLLLTYHQLALPRADALKYSFVNPDSIGNRMQRITKSNIAQNRYIRRCRADAILFCGKQSIALRGHRDDSTADSEVNKGNFLAFLDYRVRSGNAALAKHLKEASKNAIYTSKNTQNQLIECIGDHIRHIIIQEIKQAKYYSVLCVEVVDLSTKEQVSKVLKFVDSNRNIREEFLDFVGTERITGDILAREIKKTPTKFGLDFQDCRGQG